MIDLRFKMRGPKDADMILQARGYVAALHALFGDAVLPFQSATAITGAGLRAAISDPDIAVVSKTVGGGSMTVADNATSIEPDASAVFAPTDDAATVFASQSAPGAAPVAAGDLDRDGIRWDERIHASTKTTTAGGTWTRRRNTPDDLFNSTMAELRAEAAARSGTAPAPAPASAAVIPTTVIPPPPTTTPAGVPTDTPATGEITFPTVMRKVTGMQAAKTLTPADVATILTGLGSATATIVALTQNKALIPSFDAVLDMMQAGLPVADAIAAVKG